ncbi:MAG: hypothetical protein GY778_29750 [bacterium]|nr:hypothetical protein [bacterium]
MAKGTQKAKGTQVALTGGFGWAILPFMPREARVAPGSLVCHALNRAVARLPLLQKPEDYAAFERVLVEAHLCHPMRVLAHCLMPNH